MEHAIEKSKNMVKTGKSSLRISSEGGHDTSAYASVELKSGVRYSLSAWIKTDRVEGGGMGALLNVHELGQKAMTKGIRKTNNWKKMETVFVNPSFGRRARPSGPNICQSGRVRCMQAQAQEQLQVVRLQK